METKSSQHSDKRARNETRHVNSTKLSRRERVAIALQSGETLLSVAKFTTVSGLASAVLAACGGSSGGKANATTTPTPPIVAVENPGGSTTAPGTTVIPRSTSTTTITGATTTTAGATTSTTFGGVTTTTVPVSTTTTAPGATTTIFRPTTTTTTRFLPSTTTQSQTTTTQNQVTTTTQSPATTTQSQATTTTQGQATTTSTIATSTSTTTSSTAASTTTTTNIVGGPPNPVPLTGRAFAIAGTNTVTVTAFAGMMGPPALVTAAGNVTVWGFAGPTRGFNSDRDFPGPVIELTQGMPASITLRNQSMMNHTIHPHGLDVNTANDGVPTTSPPVAPMASKAYTFTAPFAGTYLYHCHVDAALHFEMGMYATIIVRPPSGSSTVAWDGGPAFTREYIWQLHTIDTRWHTVPTTGPGTLRYRPNVFMINGRDGAGPANDAATTIVAAQGSQVLLRLVGFSYMPAIVELGGLKFDVIASDGRPLKAPITGQTMWRVLPGERYDLLLTMPAAGTRAATVTYKNIRGTATLGTATTTITSV